MHNLLVSYHAPIGQDHWEFTPFKSTTQMAEYYKKYNLEMYIDCYVLEWDEDLAMWIHVDGRGNRRICEGYNPDEAMAAAGWIIDNIVKKVLEEMG